MNYDELYETIVDFREKSQNAIKNKWLISPIEYFWIDGKNIFDRIFNNSLSDTDNALIVPLLFKTTTNINFRSKMIVLGFMRQPISKKYSLEIENGLIHLYRLDFLSAISQWVYIIEGYMREIFNVQNGQSAVDPSNWVIPKTNDPHYYNIIGNFVESLSSFSENILYCKSYNSADKDLNRHLLLHGKVHNKNFYSQENTLKLFFALDTLLAIEMVSNQVFPAIFSCNDKEAQMIERRIALYSYEWSKNFDEMNILKNELLTEHLYSFPTSSLVMHI